MLSQPMYEIWRAHGGRSSKGPRFRLLCDALRHVHSQDDGATYAIRTPDGTWHHFETTGHVTLRRNRTSGVFPAARPTPADPSDVETGAA
jgi:hypothetical protein